MNNDRLKFRAWDGCDMIYFDLSLCNSESQEWFDNTIWRNPVMQFTGLYDCNGVEIYDGDILQDSKRGILLAAVGGYFSELSIGFGVHFMPNGDGSEFAFDADPFGIERNATVIGNIHQHNNLLDGAVED